MKVSVTIGPRKITLVREIHSKSNKLICHPFYSLSSFLKHGNYVSIECTKTLHAPFKQYLSSCDCSDGTVNTDQTPIAP